MPLPRWRRLAISALKLVVAVLVVSAVTRHVVLAWNDLSARTEPLRFELGWLAGAGLLYVLGLAAYGRFFERILHSSATPVKLGPALCAYVVSHLGKYVPGKAMVVVIRAGMVVPFGARASSAAIATFYETLVMMAAGGLLAAAGFAAANGPDLTLLRLPVWGQVALPLYRVAALLGLVLGVGFLTVVAPPVFARLVELVNLPFPKVGNGSAPKYSIRLLGTGMLWSSAGWAFLGASQLAVVRAFDRAGATNLVAYGLVPLVVSSVALATVAGFVVAVLPGGLGVREGVLMSVLAPAIGSDHAVVASLLLRLVWVASEVVAAAVLVLCFRPPRRFAAAARSSASQL
jgi:glycosyltransferase 2 family protein